MKKKLIDKFVNDQLSQWPLACDNFRALKNICVKEIEVGGLGIQVQFNPARIRSSAADVSPETVRIRRCFLCRDNRPHEQKYLRFEGRKSKRYDILVNPYPIFPGHLVMVSDKHINQAIWKRYVDMLDMARTYNGYSVFYNGPHCGASAPDHFHFQAAPKGSMPLEVDVDFLLDQCKHGNTAEGLRELVSMQDAHLFHYGKFTRGIFALRASTIKTAAKMFYRLIDCMPGLKEGEEPMFNLISWYKSGEYRSVVIFRGSHRPHHYYEEGDGRLVVSPGCADMAGVFIASRQEDYDKLDAATVMDILSEVSVSKDVEEGIISRLTRTQPRISVGITSGKVIEFEIISDGAGSRFATYYEGKIEYDGALYDELFFEARTPSMMFAEPSFILHGVTIGVDFHWERKESQKFAGALKIIVEKDKLTAVNVIGVEDYLLSVISSEMKSTSSEEFLKAHAVISRSWVMSLLKRKYSGASLLQLSGRPGFPALPEEVCDMPSIISYLDMVRNRGEHIIESDGIRRHIKWYGHNDHHSFDVCADDHCQRYQGLTRAVGRSVRNAVDATWGEVLMYGGEICDARFSKCCGGTTERFSVCWEDEDYAYLKSVPDSVGDREPFCSNPDKSVIRQVLNDYDLETPDFYRWTVSYDRNELSEIVCRKSGIDIGLVQSLIPLKRGDSGRIYELLIKGDKGSVVVGKELEIRKILSESHLKSSAFDIEYIDENGATLSAGMVENGTSIYHRIILHGSGWGHGVGLCQIGAAVMASEGYGYREILSHYYPGAGISKVEN